MRRHKLAFIPLALSSLLASAMLVPIAIPRAVAATRPPPNVVLIVTDDQRWDTLSAMHIVRKELGGKGVTFSNAFVANPLCSPSRSSILSGQYSHTTGVWTNHRPSGGFRRFDDSSTIATSLDEAGYRTGLFGKYLNQYGQGYATGDRHAYIPPGWDQWFSTLGGGYYDYRVADDHRVVKYGDRPSDYGTNVIAQHARNFILSTEQGKPLFVEFAPNAPHRPATSPPVDRHAFPHLPQWRPPSYNERNVKDKPTFVRRQPRISPKERRWIDGFRLRQYQSLLAVDRSIGTLIGALKRTGRLSNTMIIFTSDNGLQWGEHRLHRKTVPYEESIRVPLIIRYPGVAKPSRITKDLALNVDLAPTIADAAGVADPGVEGLSLLPVLANPLVSLRPDLNIEQSDEAGGPSFCEIHTKTSAYTLYGDGQEELYHLDRDPFELRNLARLGRSHSELLAMRARVRQLCDPPPPGFDPPHLP